MPALTLTGLVTKAKLMRQTCTVTVTTLGRHTLVRKPLNRTKNYLVHDEREIAKVGDRVNILHSSRKLSARKRFILQDILSDSAPAAGPKTTLLEPSAPSASRQTKLIHSASKEAQVQAQSTTTR
ncbi:uncharacterized protein L969DRAFT_104023 [Mixia osmundae IAM 14324]|uniref:30S ribosomal protein S17 n=1 Tax=Mixia osmundae (strain CBS 9802 / IAM 14324 / JCM 22182 / KY 12970) TaxID=764103 RepID=G7E6V0_MIXOS|nr:uncharacterized protein L969DRAFT_104023 [Mixia osmundae IAM 14324]KEI39058.1 hypothetical protein L969DRAFT_104023 [Mixia osmundae IAM 14324]GAA98560.1 hypothetical protein E5Q_05247 [Mixia osmundae IAM 14324]